MIDKNCMNCGWAKQIPDFKIAKLCKCPLSGCYNTDVTEYEQCDKWKEQDNQQEEVE